MEDVVAGADVVGVDVDGELDFVVGTDSVVDGDVVVVDEDSSVVEVDGSLTVDVDPGAAVEVDVLLLLRFPLTTSTPRFVSRSRSRPTPRPLPFPLSSKSRSADAMSVLPLAPVLLSATPMDVATMAAMAKTNPQTTRAGMVRLLDDPSRCRPNPLDAIMAPCHTFGLVRQDQPGGRVETSPPSSTTNPERCFKPVGVT